MLWIAFTSIYFSVETHTLRVVALCFASTINATVTLITLFITKAYVVLLRPQKNTRGNVMSRRKTRTYDTVSNHLANLSRMATAGKYSREITFKSIQGRLYFHKKTDTVTF